MRRVWVIGLALISFIVSWGNVAAQGGTLADVIDSRDDLSVLSAFLDAAPTVRETLSTSGSYTVFAPTNTAFSNLASTLDIPLAELIRSPEVVTALLEYHTLAGVSNINALRARDGQVLPTQLFGAFIGLRVDADGALTINNVVAIETPNIGASNGILHVVDDVLLNRVVDDIIETVDLNTLITPNVPITAATEIVPTVTTTALITTPTAVPTQVSVPASNVRLVYLASDAPALDVFIAGEAVINVLASGTISPFITLEPGIYTLDVRLDGASADDEALLTQELTLLDGDFVTVVVQSSVDDTDALTLTTLDEDFGVLPDGTSRVLLLNALAGGEPVTIRVDDETLVESLATGETNRFDRPFGRYDLRVLAADDPEMTLLDPDPVQLLAGAYYFVAITGEADDPLLVIDSVSADDAAGLRLGDALITDADSDPTSAPDSADDLLTILSEDEDFEILLAALEAADSDVLDRLQNEDGEALTVLAPTDDAFVDLLATLDISQERLLTDRSLLTQILLYHLIEGEVTAADFRAGAGTSIVTVLQPNQAFTVSVNNAGTIFLNGRVQFVLFDVRASNGIIHILDDVLLPQVALDAFGL